jgi:hypothetical protein
VDGVLIRSGGYHRALVATVDRFAAQMGLPPVGLTRNEIATFESLGLSNEWDSAAMCAGSLLLDALATRPDLRRDSLAATLDAIRAAGSKVRRRDFGALSRDLMAHHPPGTPYPSRTFLSEYQRRADASLHPLLHALLGDVNSHRSPTTYLFQHHTLGSRRFAETYGEPPAFEVESYLTRYDGALIAAETLERLLAHTSQAGWGMALFTARASLPPADCPEFDPDHRHLHPPEGDLAAEVLGVAGRVPLIAGGRLTWLGRQRGKGVADYVKPSAVHALAAVGGALCGGECAALIAAAGLAEEGRLSGPLADLAQGSTRAVIFEDAPGGIRGGRRAAEMLRAAGCDLALEAVGVAEEPVKREALTPLADRVVGTVEEAVAPYLE